MFADTYTAVRETSAAVYKYESASLKYEYAKLAGLPPPLNVLFVPVSILQALAKTLMRQGKKEDELPIMSEDWLSVLKKVKAKMA